MTAAARRRPAVAPRGALALGWRCSPAGNVATSSATSTVTIAKHQAKTKSQANPKRKAPKKK